VNQAGVKLTDLGRIVTGRLNHLLRNARLMQGRGGGAPQAVKGEDTGGALAMLTDRIRSRLAIGPYAHHSNLSHRRCQALS